MTSENAGIRSTGKPETTPENRKGAQRLGDRASGTALPDELQGVLAAYKAALASAPLSAETRRTYVSKVRQFLAWLAGADVEGDPLGQPIARDWAVRDYRTHLQAVSKRAPATVNNALAALDDFYTRRGLGPAAADRAELATLAPRALDTRAALRWLRAVEAQPSARDRALAAVPFYAGARIAETVRLDVEDIALSARRGSLRLYGKGEKVREVPIHPQLRTDLGVWLRERAAWPGADHNAALFLNRRGGRLSVRGASDVIAAIAERADLDEEATAHILRHTFATVLVRGGTDLVLVAELLGHSRLATTRGYTRPTVADRAKALELLPVDH